jgi:lipoyl(octanoyl) transferase
MNKWRLIFTGDQDAFYNMALDEALLFSCEEQNSPPILRLYGWNPPGISLGYSQSIARTIDLKKCREHHIDVVRRITGGRAVLHENERTYCICADTGKYPNLGQSTIQTYQKISAALLESLRFLGITADWHKPSREAEPQSFHQFPSKPCFVSTSRYEITVKGRKLIGSAQRRFGSRSGRKTTDSFIQHGSILAGKERHSIAEFLPEGNPVESLAQSLEERSINFEEILKRPVKTDEMISALKSGFHSTFDIELVDSCVTEAEQEKARTLNQEKYLSEIWNYQR